MNGFQMMLKGFGVKVDDATLRQIEAILPVLPAKVNEVIEFISKRTIDYDLRLARIEAALERIENHESKREHRPAGNGNGR